MSISVALARKLEEIDPQLRGVLFAILEEIERQREETVTKKEFNELKVIVKDLAEALKETEKRVNELTEAQKETEKRVNELAEAQKETQRVMNELAEAQKRTEIELAKTRSELGGISDTIGFTLENEAYKFLPALLKNEFGLEIRSKLVRKFVTDYKGEQIEVNIVGEATRNGHDVVIIGEAKAQLFKSKIDKFLDKKLRRLEGVFRAEVFPILVTDMISEPDVAEYAHRQGIKRLYYSYEFAGV